MKRWMEYMMHEERLKETFYSALRRGGLTGISLLSSVTQHKGTVQKSQILPRDSQKKEKM